MANEKTIRPQLPSTLCEELLEVAHKRGRTEQQLAPILRHIMQEWIEDDGSSSETEGIRELHERLDRLEELIRTLHVQMPGLTPYAIRPEESHLLDETTEGVLNVLVGAADKTGLTPPLSQKQIASDIAESFVTARVVGRAIETLKTLGLIRIAKKSGQRVAARYRIIGQNTKS